MLIGSHNAYDILGIDRNADTRTIKKAYAKLVKQYHPEENPEEWKRIHDAYESAIKNASEKRQYERYDKTSEETYDQTQIPHMSVPQTPNIPVETFGETPVTNMSMSTQEKEILAHTLSESQKDELEAVFGNVEKVVRDRQNEQEKIALAKIERELQTIRQMTKKRRLRGVDEWTRFFSRRNLLPIISRSEFLTGMGDCLTSKTIDDEVYTYLSEQLERIIKYLKKNHPNLIDSDSNMDAVRYVRDRLISGNTAFRKKRGIAIKIMIAVFVLDVFLGPLLEDKYSIRAQYQRNTNTSQTIPESKSDNLKPEPVYSDTQRPYSDTEPAYPDIGLTTLNGGQILLSPDESKEMYKQMLEDGVISQEEYDSFILELEESSAKSQGTEE